MTTQKAIEEAIRICKENSIPVTPEGLILIAEFLFKNPDSK